MIFIVSLLFFALNIHSQTNLQTGVWKGVLKLNDSTELPFNFEVKNISEKIFLEIINGTERINVNEIYFHKDSVFIKLPVFDSEFRCLLKGDSLKGTWYNHSRKDKNRIPFIAKQGESRFITKPTDYISPIDLSRNWEATFSPGTKDESKGIGVFKQNGLHITGTFLTETGDYRYLEGQQGFLNTISFSCFDGSHAFLFTGKVSGDSIVDGHFYSGAHWHEPWVARRNENFKLRNPDSLTYLKPGYSKVDFKFKNLEGKDVSLSDVKFKNKVVIIQLMGTWCPNCMDETKFLASFYDKYKTVGLEIVALAFERTDDFAKAVNNIQRSKTKFNASYEFLITGKTGALQASEALPMLNKVMAFPTTIYIDKKGNVRKVYTGFYGPATGAEYDKFVEETTLFTEKLLAE